MRHLGASIAVAFILPWIPGAFGGAAVSAAEVKKKAEAREHMKPFIISFKDAEKEMSLLSGPPRTKGLRSGFVILRKGESMHEHSTERCEETLVILAGEGEALFPKHAPIAFKEGSILYIPPDTRHSVKNIGAGPLRYIYLVAPAGKAAL